MAFGHLSSLSRWDLYSVLRHIVALIFIIRGANWFMSIIIKVLTYLSPLYVLGWVVAVSCRSHPKRIKWLCFEILKLSILARISYTLVPEMRWIHTQRVTPFYSLSHLLSLSVELTTEETSSPSTEWESWAKWWDEWFLSCRTQTDTWRHIEWNNDYQIGLGTNSFSWCQFYRCIRELMPDYQRQVGHIFPSIFIN